MLPNAIPIIDLNASESLECKLAVADVDAALKHGFFFITNHGISETMVQSAFHESKKFFNLDLDVKEKYQMNAAKEIFGYIKPNQQKLDYGKSPDRRESFDFLWRHLQRLQQDSILECVGFYPAVWNLTQACIPLVVKLLKLVAQGMRLKSDTDLLERCKFISDPQVPTYTAFRSLFYPQSELLRTDPNSNIRLAPHTDFGILTLLFHDSVGGLEVKMDNGSWLPVTPVPGAILVNTGNILELWSGGRYTAKFHRVVSVTNSDKNRELERQCMTLFVIPDDDAEVHDLTKNSNQSEALDLPSVTAGVYIKHIVDKSYHE